MSMSKTARKRITQELSKSMSKSMAVVVAQMQLSFHNRQGLTLVSCLP